MNIRPKTYTVITAAAIVASVAATAVAQGPPQVGVDTTPPNTNIIAKPKNPTKISNKPKVKFRFSSTEKGGTFQCAVTNPKKPSPTVTFNRCTSPYSIKSKVGTRKFFVRAIDKAGNVDPSAAVHSWKTKNK